MAITDKLFETNSELEKIVEGAGKTIPEAGERTDIVSHLNYTLDLLKAMVSPETAAEADAKLASGFNGIQDKLDVVNFLLASGELPSGGDEVEVLPTTTFTFESKAQDRMQVVPDLSPEEYGETLIEVGHIYECFFDGESLGVARCEHYSGRDSGSYVATYENGLIEATCDDGGTEELLYYRVIYNANDDGDHTVRIVKIK